MHILGTVERSSCERLTKLEEGLAYAAGELQPVKQEVVPKLDAPAPDKLNDTATEEPNTPKDNESEGSIDPWPDDESLEYTFGMDDTLPAGLD